jgi:LPS sulfotransferase NodH
LRTVWARRLPTWNKSECPIRWLDEVRREHVDAGQTLLIKLLFGQLSDDQFGEIIHGSETIVCERDVLDTLVSLKQAQASGVWNVLSDGRGMFGNKSIPAEHAPLPVTILPSELQAQRELHRRFATATENLPWRICFRDIVEKPLEACARLGEWLGMSVPAPTTRRVVARPLHERIANWLEIAECNQP